MRTTRVRRLRYDARTNQRWFPKRWAPTCTLTVVVLLGVYRNEIGVPLGICAVNGKHGRHPVYRA